MWESIDGGWSVKIRFDVCDWAQSSPGLVQVSLRASPWVFFFGCVALCFRALASFLLVSQQLAGS